MKILKLRFKNLNSLYGEWEIDFSNPEYQFNGIFAITGPTGAGKSTIMDAVCLALYGRTPRLVSINKSTNEIMSRQTADCLAEVTFSTQSGTWRCSWAQHRARNSVSGNLTTQHHELVNHLTSEVIESSIKGVEAAIPRITGMDYERFTRSILLAQGGFAAFLQARPADRAPILEEITGTEIYSIISIRVFQRQKEEYQRLENLKAESGGIVLLAESEKAALKQSLENAEKTESTLAARKNELHAIIQWQQKIQELTEEVQNFKTLESCARGKIEDFRPQLLRLNLALKANELEGSFSSLQNLRQQQSADIGELARLQQEQSRLNEILHTDRNRLEESRKNLETAEVAMRTQRPMIQQVRLIDQQVEGQQKQAAAIAAEIAKIRARIAENADKIDKCLRKIAALTTEKEEAEAYLQQNRADQALIGSLQAIAAKMDALEPVATRLKKLHKEIDKGEKSVEKLEKQLSSENEQVKSIEVRHQQAVAETEKASTKLNVLLNGQTLADLRTQREKLLRQTLEIKNFQSFAEERGKLHDGHPCPLCGSTSHPFAEGQIPQADAQGKQLEEMEKLIRKGEKLEAEIINSKDQTAQILAEKSEAEKKLTTWQQKLLAARESLEKLSEEVVTQNAELESARNTVSENLAEFGVAYEPGSDFKNLLEPLQQRLELWQKSQNIFDEANLKIGPLKAESSALANSVAELEAGLKEKELALASAGKEVEELRSQRLNLFGDKVPDEEEQKIERQIELSKKHLDENQKNFDKNQLEINRIETLIKSLNEILNSRNTQISNAGQDFSAQLQLQGFSEESAFINARLTQAERNQLQTRQQDLESELKKYSSLLQQRELELNKLQQQNLSAQAVATNQERFALLEAELKGIISQIGAYRQQLADDDLALSRLAEKQNMIKAQEVEFSRWDNLNKLIGSSDGSRYRKFAQGLTFEMLIGHANQQLQKLTRRYLLVHDPETPLELSVIDNFQAGEMRTTKNLSGGESFIVSLALALGLSAMASRKLRVDSLFLDEGFGTLDENALDTALTTLSGLHGEGKMIGIISHVTVLKDRISTQIQVQPVKFGRSGISGPGVKKL
ncbi:MAG: AAA family ATPase [Candidatus Rifleibacteriota bacterium]